MGFFRTFESAKRNSQSKFAKQIYFMLNRYELFVNFWKVHKKLRKYAILMVYAVVDKSFFQCYIIHEL